MCPVAWDSAPESLELGNDGTLHVWRHDLDRATGDAGWLDEHERGRARIFARPLDRDRFVAGRCFVRRVLARYLRQDPARVGLTADANGKPVAVRAGAPHFNLSHSRGVGYLAVTRIGPVGVDVEVDHAVEDVVSVAATVFSQDELAAVACRPGRLASTAFLRVWTRKEAVVKAAGVGIVADLRSIHVGAETDDATVSGVNDEDLFVRTLECVPGEHVAVALSRAPSDVRFYCL